MSEVNLVAFVGMPGSGKSSCVEYLSSKGYPNVYLGGLVVGEVKNRGLEVNEVNERVVREEFRAKHGMGALAVMAEAPISDMLAHYGCGVIDGLYSWSELKYLREKFIGITVVALIADRRTRHTRLAVRPKRPLSADEVNTRDISEIENLEKGGPIAYADHYILNNDEDSSHIELLYKKIDTILSNIAFPKPKKSS